MNNINSNINKLNLIIHVYNKNENQEDFEEFNLKIRSVIINTLESMQTHLQITPPNRDLLNHIQLLKEELVHIAQKCSNVHSKVINIEEVRNHVRNIQILRHGFETLPENIDDLPPGFTEVPLAVIETTIQTEVVEVPEITAVINGKNLFNEPLKELDRLKDRLGGSPNFGSAKPSIDTNDHARTFFGFPMSSVKDWLRLVLNEKRSPQFFWKFVAKLFGVTANNKPSQYEDAYIRIQRYGMLIANKERLFQILDRQDQQRFDEFHTITGLGWHPTDNGAGTEKLYIELTEQFLTIYFEDARQKGDDALIEYFNALQGACFEGRSANLEAYIGAHPIGTAAEMAKEVEDVADVNTKEPVRHSFNKVFINLGTKLNEREESATPILLLKELQKNNVFNLEFPTNNGINATPTLEEFHEFALEMIDLFTLAPYSTAEFLQTELQIFLQSKIDHTPSNFMAQLQKREGQNQGFQTNTQEVLDFVQQNFPQGVSEN